MAEVGSGGPGEGAVFVIEPRDGRGRRGLAGRCRVLVTASAALLVASCSRFSSWTVPARTTAVRAQERRLATIVARDDLVIGSHATCRIRVLGHRGPSWYAWADCSSPIPDLAPQRSEVSEPVRVTGTTVEQPHDRSEYAGSIRHLFPGALARWIFAHPGGPEAPGWGS